MANGKKLRNPFRYLPMDLPRLFCLPLHLVFRLKRRGVDGKPYRRHLKGGAVIVGNHTSMADPFVAYATFWYRRMFYLAGELVMRHRLRSFLLRHSGCIKIDRNISDIEAIRASVKVLREGKLLSMFPQGGITPAESFDRIKAGVILIALQADVPIIPTFSLKPKHWYNRRRIVIGEPFRCRDYLTGAFPSMTQIETAARALLEQLHRCQAAFEKEEANGTHG